MPAPGSNLNTILNAVAQGVAGLGFALTGPVPVVVRKLPRREVGVDPAEQITVSGDVDLDTMTPYAFGDVFKVEYRLEVTLVTPNNDDATKNLPAYLSFRQSVRQLFRRAPLAGAAAVIGLRVEGGTLLDRDDMAHGYDVSTVVIVATCIEP